MDEKLKKALDAADLMTVINQQKRICKEQYQSELVYYKDGFQYTANQELISFCQSLVALNQDQAVILDDNGHPCLVENLAEFVNDVVQTYATATNNYYTKYTNIISTRNVEGILDL